jgi:phosphoglycolate phosphatase-like HAD superfamily hydrolase
MVGDRDSDIKCGKAAGTKTILIENPQSSKYRMAGQPDFTAANLKDALTIILSKK